jgi:hypothetical protein
MRRGTATDPLAKGPRALLVGGTFGTAAILVVARAFDTSLLGRRGMRT